MRLKAIIILSTLVFASCNSKNESGKISELTYLMLIKENNKYSTYLLENIQAKIQKDKENDVVLKYDSLTKEYLNYLVEVETELSKNSSEIFFKNDTYSNKGKEFIEETKKYKTEIEKLVVDENLRKRINLTLNTNNVQMPENVNEVAENNENNDMKIGKSYFRYLDYYYKEFSNNQCSAFLSNKKRAILEIENEFVGSLEK